MRNLATLSLVLLMVVFGRRFFIKKASPVQVNKIKENPVKPVNIIKKEPIVKKINSQVNVKPKKLIANKGFRINHKKGYVLTDAQGNLVIQSISLDGDKALVFGDVLIGNKDDVMDINRNGKSILLIKPKLWDQGIIHYEIDSSLPNYDEVEKSIKYFNDLGVVKFIQGHADNYIYFKPGENNCYSYVGMIKGEQEVSLSAHCGFREINHELMHALGFLHEQSREDRDDFLVINWDNINEEYKKQFDKISNDFLNVGDSTFDFASILLYPQTAFAKEAGLKSMTKKDGTDYTLMGKGFLSDEDFKRLKKLYENEISKRLK